MLEKAQFDLVHNKYKAVAEKVGWTATTFFVRSRQITTLEKDKYVVEILLEVKALATQFAGFP